MSLILDALKKTETSKESSEGTTSPTQSAENTTPAPTTTETALHSTTTINTLKDKLKKNPFADNRQRLIIFVALAILGLGIIVYMAFSRGLSALFSSGQEDTKAVIQTELPKPTIQISEEEETKKKEQEIIKLKKEAIALYQSSKYQQSADVYKKLVNLLPASPEIYNNYGLSLKKAGKYTEARQAYQIALALNENYPEALNNMATVDIAEQKYNDARKNLEKALELKPDYVDAHLHLALSLEKIGDLENAVKYYESFLALSEGTITRAIRLQVENRISLLKDEFVANKN